MGLYLRALLLVVLRFEKKNRRDTHREKVKNVPFAHNAARWRLFLPFTCWPHNGSRQSVEGGRFLPRSHWLVTRPAVARVDTVGRCAFRFFFPPNILRLSGSFPPPVWAGFLFLPLAAPISFFSIPSSLRLIFFVTATLGLVESCFLGLMLLRWFTRILLRLIVMVAKFTMFLLVYWEWTCGVSATGKWWWLLWWFIAFSIFFLISANYLCSVWFIWKWRIYQGTLCENKTV